MAMKKIVFEEVLIRNEEKTGLSSLKIENSPKLLGERDSPAGAASLTNLISDGGACL